MEWKLVMNGYLQSNLITFDIELLCQARAALAQSGLTLFQYRMLTYLSDHSEGIGPLAISKALHVSPALVTSGKERLVREKLIEERRQEGSASKTIKISEKGRERALFADEAIIDVCTRYFSMLGEASKHMIYSGSLLTNLTLQLSNKVRKGLFFEEYVVLQAFLALEGKFTDIAHSQGLSLNGFRVLLFLEENDGNANVKSAVNTLGIAPSKMTYVCNSLIKAGHIERNCTPMDKRSRCLSITKSGMICLSKAYDEANTYVTRGLRDASDAELNAYMSAADIIISALAMQHR